jgi:RHS repeat-associated protein
MGRVKRIIASALIFTILASSLPTNVLAASSKDSKNDLKDPDVSTASIGKIVGEVTDKRDKSTKTFRKSDGSFEATIYNTAIHYLDQGQWKDIDNSLVDAKDDKGNAILKNKENAFSVEISKNSSSDKLVNIKKDGYELSWNIEETQTNASASTVQSDLSGLLSGDKTSTDSAGVDTGTETVSQENAAPVSATVKQADEAQSNKNIEKIAADKVSKIKGYDKLSDAKKAELVQISQSNEEKKTLKNVSSSVDFKQIFKDIDLNYTLSGDTVKESIVLNKAIENPVFKFNLNVTNMVPKIDKNNNIVFYDVKDTEKVVYTMKAPYMYDAKNVSSDNINISIEKTDKGYILTVKPDSKWLNSNRAYPITIDPTVDTSIDPDDIQDSYVSSAESGTCFWLSQRLKTGYNGTSVYRTYIKFNNLPKLESSDMITNASLYVSSSYESSSYVNVHEVTGDWQSSTLTWNNKPGYNSIIEDYQQVISDDDTYTWDITNLAKKWYCTSANYGLMLKANSEAEGKTEYYSSDQDISDLRPMAEFDYVNNSGLESYWTYHSQDAGRAGIGNVNDYNGNLVLIHSDLEMNGNRMPVSISHVYNSSDADQNDLTRQWMGAGWSMNITQRIYQQTIGDTDYWVYVDDNATKKYFADDDSTSLSDELNQGYTFIKETSGSYTIKDLMGNQIKFNSDKTLNSIIDNNGNAITAAYSTSGRETKTLTSLTDGAGRVTRLEYDSNGILKKITDPAGRSTSFTYDTYTLESYPKLTQITYPDGKVSNYTYDSNSKLISATNYDGTKITYEYYTNTTDSSSRVKKVTKSNGSTTGEVLDFTYGNNQTTIQKTINDQQDKTKEIYQFNNAGNTVSVQDSEENASYYDYSDDSNPSKCTTESKMQKTQINCILNHNMEAASNWTSYSWSGATGTQSFTTEDKYAGNRSMKIASTSTNGGMDYEQRSIPLVKGNTYTFSAYVKTLGVTTGSDAGAAFFIGYQDASGTAQYVKKYISGSTDWHREELRFTLPANASSNAVTVGCEIVGATGTAYFDCLQLESGNVANRYNLIENSDFTYSSSGIPSFWTKNSDCDSSDVNTTASSDHPKSFDNNVFKFTGLEDKRKNVMQTAYVSGKSGDSLVVGGWSKADSAPLSSPRSFSITLGLKSASGDYEWHDLVFNTDSSQWQYMSKKIAAESDYVQVDYYIEYYNNINTAMFDGMQLYKEEFGESHQYDQYGQETSTSDLADQNSTNTYTSNNLTKSTDAKGNQTNYTYNSSHDLTSTTSAEGVTTSSTYDSYGNQTTAKVGGSSTFIQSSSAYTSDGNYLSSTTDSSGNTITNNWNTQKGLLNSTTDAASKTTSYTYDSNTDNLLSVSKQADGLNVTNSYSYNNDLLSSITHNGFSYNFGYDSLGNNTTVSVGSQNLITNDFDTKTGNLKTSTYANGQSVGSDYDTLGRPINKKYNGTVKFAYEYDGSGNVGYKQDNVNSLSFRYFYDIASRLTKVWDSNGNSTTFSYEGAINPITQIKLWHYYGDSRKYHDVIVQVSNDPDFSKGVTTVYNNDTENSAGRGAGTDSEYSETSSGKTISVNSIKARYVRIYSNGSTANTCNHYVEAQVNSSSVNMAKGKSVISSKAFANPNRINDGTSSDTNSYADSTPNMGLQWIQIDLGSPSTLSNNVSQITETLVGQSNPISTYYEYDKDNRESKVTINNGSYLTSSYDTLDRLSGKTVNTGTTNYSTAFSYVAGANGSSTEKVGSITNNGTAISYTYDCNNNISTITQGGQVIGYQYNELNEVIRENNQVLNKTITYSYDAGGNITSKNEYAYTTGALGTPTKTTPYSYDSNWKDKLTSYDGKSITYDANGNPLTYNGWTYTWEAGRQLKTASGNGHSISYKYDDSGIRTQKVVDGVTTNYHLAGDKVTYEENGTDKIYYTYDTANDLVSMNLNGTEYYYIRNAQGDITGLFDSAGTEVVSYTYDTWGKLISTTGSLASTVGVKNPYRYRDYRYDSETQLYYLQSRYYNPEWVRFINADGVIGEKGNLLSYNLYTYCINNPINCSDTTGKWAQNFAGFSWVYSKNNNILGFYVNNNPAFLSKAFCMAYAFDIIRLKGSWSWTYGYNFVKMSALEMAAEFYTHAVFYYSTNITIKYFKRGYNWNRSGKVIDIAYGDPRRNQFLAVWSLL